MVLEICLCVLVIISATLFIVLRVNKGGVWGILSKTLASLLFVVYGIFSLVQVTYFKPLAFCFIILGLMCGLVGDVLLDLKFVYPQHEKTYLNAGMLSFSIGHMFYLGGAIIFSANLLNLTWPIVTGIISAIVITPIIYFVSTKIMHLNYGKFLWQSLAYAFILVFMSAFSIYLSVLAQEFIIFMGGIILIFISDLVLSVNYFGENKQNDKFLIIVNHALYYAGQILMATFLYLF